MKTPNNLGLHREAETTLQDLAKHCKETLPQGVVFVLVTYTVGAGGYSGYVSNGNRDDMIKAMKETVERLESRSTSAPFAEVEELHGRKNRHDRRKAGKT